MRFFRLAALVFAIVGGSLAVSAGSVSATPLSAGSLGTGAAQAGDGLIAHVQWGHRGYRHYRPVRRYGYYRPVRRYGYYRPMRRYYRPYRHYRPYGFRPRVVCRMRFTPWGPRRVCFRR